ncbi:replication stress response regulator SDE2 [Cephus cinctus]|uniref:Replication stress response regulator SDE2 n=1 Tax=Cephus cinctus TaxID=211228 RepID=A0AAJ7BPE6_CEPCN|nr:replication stress response regulator SDE2 [Cephus cinctus]
MLIVKISTGRCDQPIFTAENPITTCEIRNHVEEITGLPRRQFYIVHNGHILRNKNVCAFGSVVVIPKVLGGKGGFGSMLRAIGAQIEKTTNREACRDLSGRRLRDINEEKRLKAWIDKQSTREEEAVERRKKKLERLCAEPKHEFKDKNYEKERSSLIERVGDAVEQGFKVAVAGGSGIKRKAEDEGKSLRKKTLMDLDLDIDSDELSTDSEDDDNAKEIKSKVDEKQLSHDSGHSSDESDKIKKNEIIRKKETSETFMDNRISSDSNVSSEDLNAKTKLEKTTQNDTVVSEENIAKEKIDTGKSEDISKSKDKH